VALVGGEDAPSVVALLERWGADLEGSGVGLPAFGDTLRRYREVQARVDAEAAKAGEAQAEAATKLGMAAAKGVLKIAASAVPGGAIIEAVGSETAEALINFLRAKLAKADLDLYLDPTGPLTEDFLHDVSEAAGRGRIAMMLDTFDQFTSLSPWLGEVAKRLPGDVLLVIAGREIPAWEDDWPGWVANATILELTAMTDADVERLVRNYYALYDRGEPDPEQVRSVVRFAHGLPLVATTAVQLWVRYQLSDLQPVGSTVIADLADRLLDGVPAEVRPAFEAAAVLRYFNEDTLAALLDGHDVKALYDELRRWPFTRSRVEGLAVHEAMREVMNEALRARSPQQFGLLNQRAADHYQRLLESAPGETRDRLRLEWLYHSIRADEVSGMQRFQEIAEPLVRYQLVGSLRTLLSDAEAYPLEEENGRLWRRYYVARLAHISGRPDVAEADYVQIGASDQADPKLRAYTLADLGTILVRLDRLAEPDGEGKATDVIQRSIQLMPEADPKQAWNHMSLAAASNARARWADSADHLGSLRAFGELTGDPYTPILADRLLAGVSGLRGDWNGYLVARGRCLEALARLRDVPALRMQVAYFTWPLTFMGRTHEARTSSEQALKAALELEEKELMVTILESIALALGMADDHAGASQRFDEAMNFYDNLYGGGAGPPGASERYIRGLLSFRGLVRLREGRLDEAEADLERALQIKAAIDDRIGMPEVHVWLGQIAELRTDWDRADQAYGAALELRDVGRSHLHCAALTGRVRARAAAGRVDEISEAAAEAELLARTNQYHDHLSAIRLTQAELAWRSRLPGGPSGFDAAASFYRESLVFAVRFNRYLLDEAVAGRPGGTALAAVVPRCQQEGAEGIRMMRSLREWWATGGNSLDGDGEGSISSIRLGILLVEAERAARAGEPTPPGAAEQTTVIEHLDAAIS
jgi:tetratricopeptide (TPR) repeat protein